MQQCPNDHLRLLHMSGPYCHYELGARVREHIIQLRLYSLLTEVGYLCI